MMQCQDCVFVCGDEVYDCLACSIGPVSKDGFWTDNDDGLSRDERIAWHKRDCVRNDERLKKLCEQGGLELKARIIEEFANWLWQRHQENSRSKGGENAMTITPDEIEKRYTYHAPKEGQPLDTG